MKNNNIRKMMLITIFSTVLIVILSLTALWFCVPHARKSQLNIIIKFYRNEELLKKTSEKFKDLKLEKICLKKEELSSTTVSYNEEQYSLKKNDIKELTTIIKKLDIQYISKEKQNIIINFNSQINFAQSIVYIKDISDFEYGHIIINKIR